MSADPAFTTGYLSGLGNGTSLVQSNLSFIERSLNYKFVCLFPSSSESMQIVPCWTHVSYEGGSSTNTAVEYFGGALYFGWDFWDLNLKIIFLRLINIQFKG